MSEICLNATVWRPEAVPEFTSLLHCCTTYKIKTLQVPKAGFEPELGQALTLSCVKNASLPYGSENILLVNQLRSLSFIFFSLSFFAWLCSKLYSTFKLQIQSLTPNNFPKKVAANKNNVSSSIWGQCLCEEGCKTTNCAIICICNYALK